MLALLASLYAFLARQLAGRGWRWRLAAVAWAVALVFQVPRLPHAYAQLVARTERPDPKLLRAQQQALHPLAPYADDPRTHEAKMTYRLAVPLLLRWSGLPLLAVLGGQVLLGLWVFWAAGGLLAAARWPRPAVALLVLALARTYFGFACTYDLSGYFDGLGYAALLAALVARRAPLVALLVLAGAFVDERVLLASPLLVLWHGARRWHWQPPLRRWLTTAPAGGVYAAWAAYGAIRLALGHVYGLPTAVGLVGWASLAWSAWHELLALGVANALKGFWLPVWLAGAVLWQQRQRPTLLLLLGCAAPAVAGALLVTDITRSLAYATPLVFICLHYLARHTPPAARPHLALVVCAVCFLMPSYYTTGWLQYAAPAWLAALRQWSF